MAKDRNGNKKSMVNVSIGKGDIHRLRYQHINWWLSFWINAIIQGQKDGIDKYGIFDYERDEINVEMSEFEWYQNGGRFSRAITKGVFI